MKTSKIFEQYYYTKKHKPRKVIHCCSCKKKSMKLISVDCSYISGDLHVYKCKCGSMTKTIL